MDVSNRTKAGARCKLNSGFRAAFARRPEAQNEGKPAQASPCGRVTSEETAQVPPGSGVECSLQWNAIGGLHGRGSGMPNKSVPSPEQIELIFQQAFDLAAEDRADFLHSACGGDAVLLDAVATLLQAAERSQRNPVWSEPALYNEARLIDEQFRTGVELDRYRLLERIGAGGMGSVYRAVRSDDQYSKTVAIKLCDSWDSATIERLRQERQILAGLEHPSIARLLDGGATSEGVPFLAMEYVEGVPIDRYVAERKLPPREILELFRKICAAVSYAHRNLVVHRDLKPANILVTSQGEPKLLDFGIAKLLDGSAPRTRTGIAPMTPEYASPEQVRGGAITTATDTYSLGVLLYELLSGARPYSVTGNPLELANAIVNQTPRPLRERMGRRCDADLENIVRLALRKEPERRYASVDQFSEDIGRYLSGYPVVARSPSRAYRLRKFVGRNRGVVVASSFLLVALLAGIAATLYQARIANERFNDVRQLAHAVIFDYHDAIEPLPGSTPVRRKLVQDALVYLDKLSHQKTDASLKRELVEGFVKISNVQGNGYESNLGDTTGALSSAARAVGLGEQLVAADRSPESRRALASAYVILGDLLSGTNRLQEAARNYRSAIALEDAVVQDLPDDVDGSTQLAATLRHYGDLLGREGQSNLGQTAAALASYRRAVAITEGLAQRKPDLHSVQRALYDGYLALGSAELTAGHLLEAEQDQRRAVEMIRRIATSGPAQTSDQVELAGACLQLVQVLVDNGKPLEALPYVMNAAAIMQVQARADPSNALYRRNLAVTETHVANVMRRAGDPAGAARHAQQALKISEQLSSQDPNNAESLSDVANSHMKLAEALLDEHKPSEALGHDRDAISILKGIAGASSDSNISRLLVRAELAAGEAEFFLDEVAASGSDFNTAVALASIIVNRDPGRAFARTELARGEMGLARCAARQGRWREARDYYSQALEHWTTLQKANALAHDDTLRLAEAQRSLGTAASRLATEVAPRKTRN